MSYGNKVSSTVTNTERDFGILLKKVEVCIPQGYFIPKALLLWGIMHGIINSKKNQLVTAKSFKVSHESRTTLQVSGSEEVQIHIETKVNQKCVQR